jgi:hypothetical protein
MNKSHSKQQSTRPLSQREIKDLRRAEARHRIELLQEAKTLHDHLADFWDESLDGNRDRHATDMRLYYAELETIIGSTEDSGDTTGAYLTDTALQQTDFACATTNVARRQ